ncbi:MAG: hypothetical protein ABEJ05_13310 [Haloglomus sp.]
MWGSRDRNRTQVTCIACGEEVPRTAAREYDKHGDRWDRADKEFEFLCKECHTDLCHQPRGDLESALVESGAGETDRESFIECYTAIATGEAEEEAGNERER